MKIGLSGIPGSGKTELAIALKEVLKDEYKSIQIIDDYVSEIEKESNRALSFTAAYVGNLHVALGRAARECHAYENDDFVITCGTLFETSSYVAQSFEKDFQFVITDEDKYDFAHRSEATMRVLACFYLDLVKYDHVFHLLPVSDFADDDHKNLDRNLQAAFEAFKLYEHHILEPEGSDSKEIAKNRVEKVLEVIRANNIEKQDVQTKKSDGSGV